MAKKVKRSKIRKAPPSPEIVSALRAFVLSHREEWNRESILDLKLYLEAYHDYRKPVKTIEEMLLEEMKKIAIEMKAMHMEEDLFSPQEGKDRIRLGSCFCPECGRFKNYKKECPHCGHLEFTV